MAPLLLLTLFLQGMLADVLGSPPAEVWGYLGESVRLPSGVDPSWNISSIHWSIFPNITWIATYRQGNVNTNRYLQYAGRLHLNTTSGDLLMDKIILDDAREYLVEIRNSAAKSQTNRVKLQVKRHPQKPKLLRLFNATRPGGCWVALSCSSPNRERGVRLSWSVVPAHSATLRVIPDGEDNTAEIMLASINSTGVDQKVDFTCAAGDAEEQAASVLTESCGDEPEAETAYGCAGHTVTIVILILVVLSIAITYLCRGRLGCSPSLNRAATGRGVAVPDESSARRDHCVPEAGMV